MYTKLLLGCLLAFAMQEDSCNPPTRTAESGVHEAKANVVVGSDNLTTEQRNVRDRLALDNKVGSIKHLYVISAFSGQVLIYSTVKGKVTSSGKRLSPRFIPYAIGNGGTQAEQLEDDGTFGDSTPYLYWWDVQGRYHQHYVSGGQIVHISDQPIPVKSITINMEFP